MIILISFFYNIVNESEGRKRREEHNTYREGLTLTPPVRFFFIAAAAVPAVLDASVPSSRSGSLLDTSIDNIDHLKRY